MKKLAFLTIGLLTCACSVYAIREQTSGKPDEDIPLYGIDPYDTIPCPNYISIEDAESKLSMSGINFCFRDLILNHPATMQYDFYTMQRYDPLVITDSPDKLIRCYVWDTHMGGVSPYLDAMYQINDNGTIYAYDGLPDWYGPIHIINDIVHVPTPKTDYYVFISQYKESATMANCTATVYQRDGHTMRRANLFDDGNGKLTDHITFYFDLFHQYLIPRNGYFKFLYDNNTETLYSPQIDAEGNAIDNDRYIPYRWNGSRFTATANCGNPTLCEQLQDYVSVVQVFQTQDLLIRIDSLETGYLRYAAWYLPDGDKKTDTPRFVLTNGWSDSTRYYFRNQTYSYVVTKEERPAVEVYYGTTDSTLGVLQSRYYAE